MLELISKEMLIGEVVEKYPAAADVFMNFGLHCIGCHVSPHESIEQGALGHGMDEKTVEDMIQEANKVVKSEKPRLKAEKAKADISSMDVTITDKAIEKIKEIMKTEKQEGSFFRVGVAPGGCSGFSYAMSFDDKKADDDKLFDKHGLKVLVDKDSLGMLNGASIDFVETLHQSGFKIDNPNAHKTCGCGNSFG